MPADIEGFSQVAGPAGDVVGQQGDRGGQQIVGGGRGDPSVGRGVGRGGGQAGTGNGDLGRGGTRRRIRARAWTATINNYRAVPRELPQGVRYMIFGEEVSQRGTPHLQGYVVFENAVSQPSQYFSEFGNGHFELAMGSAMQNITYCSKDGKFTEHGVRPQDQRDQGHHGAKGGKRNAGRWEEAWQAAKRGNIDEVPADIRWKYYSTFTKVATRYRTPPAELEKLDNMWIMGPSGTGKSYFVHRTFPGAYKKDFNRWWDNFEVDNDAHQTVILDDLHFKWAEKERLKNWADVYPFMAEFKGGSMMIRPKRIVVTSNFHPQQV